MTQPLPDFQPDWAVPPGETLAESLSDNNITVEQFVVLSGFRKDRLDQILSGEMAIDLNIANVLQVHTGISAMFWLNMERVFRTQLWRAWRKTEDDNAIPHCECGQSRDDAHHCKICHENLTGPLEVIVDHIRVQHPDKYEEPERWPDGGLVIEEPPLDVQDMLDARVEVYIAREIQSDSWLNAKRFADFRRAYSYASGQTRAIEALASISPEQAYFVYQALKRGHEREAGTD